MTPGDPPELVEPPEPEHLLPTEPVEESPNTAPPRPAGADDLPPTEPQPALLGIDSWMDAPPGTFPGLADPHEDDLDRAFAHDGFRHYDDRVLPLDAPLRTASESPYGMPPDDAPVPSVSPLEGRRLPLLIGACVVVIAVVALIAAFVGGRAAAGGPIDTAATVSASPTPTLAPLIRLATPGTVPWDRLAGGECLTGYTSPWADSYTVVPCTAQHTAQLVIRAAFPDAKKAAYPGTTALEQRMSALCTATGVIDLSRASAVTDLQYAAAYPATRGQWQHGDRDYFCFVSRSSGAPITGSIAGPAHEAAWAARSPSPRPDVKPSTTSSPTPKKHG